MRATEAGTRLVQYSAELYASLEAETGLATGYHNVGGLIVARTEERMVQLRRTAANAVAYDLDCRMLTADEAGERWPPMRTDDLLGGIWLPGDGKVNPTDLTQSLAKGARQRGARVAEGVRVTGFLTEDGPTGRRVTGVRTDHGDVETESVVVCAGQWSKALGDLAGVTVPLHSAEHFYVVTDTVEGTHPDLPVHARPRRLDLLQGGGRRPRRRRVRARGQALGRARPDPLPVRVRRCSTRTGSTSRC